MYYEFCRKAKNELSLCSSHERGSPMKFWSRRPIHKIFGFGGDGWYFGFLSYDTDKQIITSEAESEKS